MISCLKSLKGFEGFANFFQISYAIGVSHPLSMSVFHYGTSQRDEDELLQIVQKNFDLRPGVIVKYVWIFCILQNLMTVDIANKIQ